MSDRRREVAEGLRDLLSVVNSGRPLAGILDEVLAQAGRLLGSDAGAVYLRDPDDALLLSVYASRGLEPSQLALKVRVGSPVTGLAVARRLPVIAPNLAATLQDSLSSAEQSQLEEGAGFVRVLRMGPRLDPDLDTRAPRVRRLIDSYRAALAVPLAVKDETYGAISLYYVESREFSLEEIELAATFADQTALAIENARLRAQTEQRARELEALYRADEVLYRSLRVEAVLEALVDVATDILAADKTAVVVWDAARERLRFGASRGFKPETAASFGLRLGEGLVGQVALQGEPATVEDTLADPRVLVSMVDAEGIRACVHVPIRVGGEIFGVFNVNYLRPRAFDGTEQRLLLALAQRAALALQNARLYEQASQAAVLEERQRLARELHDAVTQTLFSAGLIAEVLPRLWERSPDEGRRRTEELRRLARGATAEMRALLLELRPGALAEAKLGDLLRQLADATAGRAQLGISVSVDGDRPLPESVQLALYRIAQESLNNVLKHARAKRVELALRLAPAEAELRVTDDGCGFDTSHGSVPAGHFGLGIMRERAASIGAELTVESHANAGCRVTALWRDARPT